MERQERQLGFSDWERSVVKKQTRREKFLSEMEKVVPWSALLSLIASFYPVQGPQGGRPPYPAETMLRIHLMQNWYCLSDEAMEDALIEVESMRRFAHLDLAKGWIPDASTILAFRHFLEKHDLGAKLFERVGEYLREQGLLLREGTVVDATIIHAPTSTKNEKRERDPEMHQTRKGNQWSFGMKVHIGVDKDSGLIHSVATRAANSSDVVVAPELLHGEEKVVYGDAGYQGLQKREEMEGKEVECRIAMRAGNRRRLPATAEGELLRWVERAKAHIRAKVEHPFRVIKEQFGFCRTRLRGMYKNHCKVSVLAALANLVLAKKRLLRLGAS